MRSSILLVACLWLCGCSKSNDDLANGNLTIGVWYEPTTLDPHTATLPVTQQIITALYTGLVTYNGAGQIVPGIAESWNVSPDGMTYVFRLKPAKWSDNSAIAADTFVQSFRRLFEQHNNATLLLSSIHNGDAILAGDQSIKTLGVKALADDIVEIKLDRPLPSLLAVLAGPAGSPIPKMALRKPAFWWRDKANIITNGDYTVEKWTPGIELVLKQHDVTPVDHTTALHTIRYVLMRDAQSALTAFKGGYIQILDVNSMTINTLENSPRATRDALHWEPMWAVTGLRINTSIEQMKDVRVRRALALAIDRQALIEAAFPDQHFMPSVSILPPTLPGYGVPASPDWSAWSFEQRQSEAARLLQETGYTVAHPLILKLNLANHDEDQRLSQALKDQLTVLPIRLVVEQKNLSQITQSISVGEYQLARQTLSTTIDSPEQFLLSFRCASKMAASAGYCNSEVDALLSSAQKQSDIALRSADLHRAETLLLDDGPFIPLYVPVNRNLVSKKLGNYVDSPTAIHMLNSLKPRRGRL